MLETVSLTKVYKSGQDKVFALKDVGLKISTQDYVSIVGPSGAGKSTLLHVLGGLDTPSSGKVVFSGKDIYRMNDKELSSWRNEKIGFIFQFYHLIEELNVLENLLVPFFCRGRRRKQSLKRAEELLQYLGIGDRRNFFPSQLSGGEKQRVAIARALINDPEIVFCDEPTGNLDKNSQTRVIDLLEELNKKMKKSVVLVTHNLELAKRAKRVLFIEQGTIVSGNY